MGIKKTAITAVLYLQPERVPGIISVRPDTSDTGETALLPELATSLL